jgi:membrane protease YdiL (CAAX protease family)
MSEGWEARYSAPLAAEAGMDTGPARALDAGASTTPSVARGRVLAVLLATWFIANSLTHILVYIATGGIYYQLPLMGLLGAEASIGFLNFLLPILAVRFVLREPVSFAKTFGWTWTGWKVPALGIGGFALFMAFSTVTDKVFANASIQYGGPGMAGPRTWTDYLIFTLMLLIFPALCEETMFRGFLQTRITTMYGPAAGILVPAVLFAVRHHPSDIYFGILNHVPLAGWVNRGVQLYVGAIIFGLVRHYARSTWASWLLHMMVIILILILGGFFRAVLGLH